MKRPELVQGHRFEIMRFHFLTSDDWSPVAAWCWPSAECHACRFNCLTVVTVAPTKATPNAINSATRAICGAMGAPVFNRRPCFLFRHPQGALQWSRNVEAHCQLPKSIHRCDPRQSADGFLGAANLHVQLSRNTLKRFRLSASELSSIEIWLTLFELTCQRSNFFREPSDFGLIGRHRLLKSLQLIRSSLLEGLQIMDRLSRFIRGRRICTTLRHWDGFVDPQDRK